MMPTLSRRHLLALTGAAIPAFSHAQPAAWATLEVKARGQKIYVNAWGGSERINAYLQWAAGEAAQRFGVQVEHVKLTDTVDAVKRVRTEKNGGQAGRWQH